jgi:hypothetical protein
MEQQPSSRHRPAARPSRTVTALMAWLRRPVGALIGIVVAAVVGLVITELIGCVFTCDGGPPVLVNTAESGFNASGSPLDEFVCITSLDDEVVSLTGWTLVDTAGHTFTFPEFELASRASVRVHTGSGTNTPADLFWDRGAAVWNDSGDSVRLLDGDGEEITSASYANRSPGDDRGQCA